MTVREPQRLRVPEALRGEAEVWRLDLALARAPCAMDWALLNADEQNKARRYRRQADRVRFVATRAALRRRLAACLGCRPAELHFTTGSHGKPELVGWDLAFNVSHSGNQALIALSRRGVVGVDIEWCNPALDAAVLEPLVMAPDEDPRSLDFFQRWVAKEAGLKAIGLGIAEGLQRLSVFASEPETPAAYRLRCRQPGGTALSIWRLPAPPGYAAALAWAPAAVSAAIRGR